MHSLEFHLGQAASEVYWGSGMKVLLVTGSYPPDVCGTADYTSRLSEALQLDGIDAHVFYRTRWGLKDVPRLLREMTRLKPDLIHMQYPTTGYGWKLGPQAIGMSTPLVVTLHEASQAHPLRQISLYPFLFRSRHFLFTNQHEKQHVERLAPWIADKSTIIPIGCNIPVAPTCDKKWDTITCFSIVRPEKGLEGVLEMAGALRDRGSFARIRIVGAIMPRWTSYYAKLRGESASLPIDWFTDLNDVALSQVLAETSVAYLPFPDGASERRSSLIAVLMNCACVITTLGKHTPEEMRDCVIESASPQDATDKAISLLADRMSAETVAARGCVYAERFSWESISQQHRVVYQRLLRYD